MASINEKSTEKVKRSEKDSSLPGKSSINYLCPVFTASLRARSCCSHCLVCFIAFHEENDVKAALTLWGSAGPWSVAQGLESHWGGC